MSYIQGGLGFGLFFAKYFLQTTLSIYNFCGVGSPFLVYLIWTTQSKITVLTLTVIVSTLQENVDNGSGIIAGDNDFLAIGIKSGRSLQTLDEHRMNWQFGLVSIFTFVYNVFEKENVI